MEIYTTELLPILGFLFCYNRFSVVTKHIALLWFLNRNQTSREVLFACIVFDCMYPSGGWVSLLAYMTAAATHAFLYYAFPEKQDSRPIAYFVAIASADPMLATDLATIWWVSLAQPIACQNALAFVGLRRIALGG